MTSVTPEVASVLPSPHRTKPRLVNPALLKEFDGPDRTGLYILALTLVFFSICFATYFVTVLPERDIPISVDEAKALLPQLVHSIQQSVSILPILLVFVDSPASPSPERDITRSIDAVQQYLQSVSTDLWAPEGICLSFDIKHAVVSLSDANISSLHDLASTSPSTPTSRSMRATYQHVEHLLCSIISCADGADVPLLRLVIAPTLAETVPSLTRSAGSSPSFSASNPWRAGDRLWWSPYTPTIATTPTALAAMADTLWLSLQVPLLPAAGVRTDRTQIPVPLHVEQRVQHLLAEPTASAMSSSLATSATPSGLTATQLRASALAPTSTVDVSVVLLNIELIFMSEIETNKNTGVGGEPKRTASADEEEPLPPIVTAPPALWPHDVVQQCQAALSGLSPILTASCRGYAAHALPLEAPPTASQLVSLVTAYRSLWEAPPVLTTAAQIDLLALNWPQIPTDAGAHVPEPLSVPSPMMVPRRAALASVPAYPFSYSPHTLPTPATHSVLSTLLQQLRPLLGFAPLPARAPVPRTPVAALAPAWEIALWRRATIFGQLTAAARALIALSTILDNAPEMPLPASLAQRWARAWALLARAADKPVPSSVAPALGAPLEPLLLTDAVAAARSAAEEVLQDPAVMPSLHFPAEHFYAVFAPMFAPMAVPLLAMMLKTAKGALVRRRHKSTG